jgi:membrane protein YdbS with pleckstrin-like domain
MENQEPTTEETFFSNDQVQSLNLPKMEDVVYEPLQPSHMYVNLIVVGIIFLFVLAGVTVLSFMVEEVKPYFLLALLAVVILFGFLTLAEVKSFKFRGYALRSHDILYRDGWLWKSWMVIPFTRIQHLEINQGPIDRIFDLASLQLFTAGGSSSDIEIDGLTPGQAADIKSFIMSKNAEINEGDVDTTI